MTWEDIVRKLTSRKFWMAVALFVSGIIAVAGGDKDTATTVTGLIMQGAAVVAYIIGEGLTDANQQIVNLEDWYVDADDIEKAEKK